MSGVLLLVRAQKILVLAALVAAAIYLAIPAPAFAADPALDVVQVGWDGQIVPGSWSPVHVRVTGGSPDLTGTVEVVSKVRIQPGPQASTVEYPVGAYGQEVALPAGVTKDVTIWVPSDPSLGSPTSSAGSVRLVVGGRTIAEERVEFRTAKTPFWPLIGVLADSPTVARAISQVELPVQGLPVPLSVARLTAADLPPSAERLSALSALVVQGNAATGLAGEQRTAIQQWVVAGGHLLLAGGPDAVRTTSILPTGALPVTFSGADDSADLSALSGWAGTRAQPLAVGPAARFKADRGALLAGSAQQPLAWRLGIGQGTVTLLAADPALEPLASWPGTPGLLQKAVEPALPAAGEVNDKLRYIQMQQRDIPSRLQSAVEALPPEAFPNWRTAALLLGGFLIVVGPLLHIVLWRTDRRVWAWGIVPVVSLLLASGMYYIGVGRDGRDVLVNVVSYLQLDPAAGPAQQALVAGFFAPTHSDLSVEIPGDTPVRPGAQGGYQPYSSTYGTTSATASAEPPFQVVSGRNTRVEFNSGQWGMRTLSISRSVDGAGGIAAHLGLDGGLIKGTIRNETPYPLEDAAVLVGQSAVRVGSLAPGQTAPVVLDPGPPATPFENRYPISWRLFGNPVNPGSSGAGTSAVSVAVPAPPISAVSSSAYSSAVLRSSGGIPEQLVVPNDPEIQRRIRLMDPIINAPSIGPGGPAMPLSFLAFTRTPIGGELPLASGHPTFFLTMIQQPLHLELPTGPFTMPTAMSTPEIVSQTGGMGSGGNGTTSWIQIQSGSMVYEFRPPLPTKSRVDAITVTTQQIGQSQTISPGKGMAPPPPTAAPGPAESGIFSIYNWQSAAWEPLPAGKEEARLQPAAPYVGPDGSVKVRVVAATDRVVMFLQPELSVEGMVVQ